MIARHSGIQMDSFEFGVKDNVINGKYMGTLTIDHVHVSSLEIFLRLKR